MSVACRWARAAFALWAVTGLAWPAPAQTRQPAPPPPTTCAGKDMLPELATSDPALHARIERETAAALNANAILWKVEKQGAAPSHIFGTVHLSDPRVVELPRKARQALDRASQVLLEVSDLSPQSSALALSAAMRLAIFTDGRSLEGLISADEFAKVKATIKRAGMPEETARLLKPWIVTMLMAGTECERKKVQEGAVVLDMRIAQIAKKRGVPISGLETIDSQLEALAGVPEDQQVEMLRASLPYAERTGDLVETTLQLYLKRRIGGVWPLQVALAEKAGFSEASFSKFQERLITSRNLKMRDRALPYLAKGGAFIAVGALHLPNATGLVALLREAGFTVTAVE